jgi:phosphoglycerate dehydrogenase-like enzyme
MPLTLHISNGYDSAGVEALSKRLRGIAKVTSGSDPVESTEVWCTGSAAPEVVSSLPQLRSVVVPWAGVPEKLIESVSCRPAVSLHNLHHNADASAEMALALLMAASRQIPRADRQIREGNWGMRFGLPEPVLLHGRTALILGWGEIGSRVGRMCRALGMKVLGVRRSRQPNDSSFIHGFEQLDSLLPQAHVLVVCTPLTQETRGMIGAKQLALMPPGGLLVNVGRGPIVDEEALYNALVSGHLSSAGIDVWYRYPKGDETCLPSTFPFHDLPNVALSPHRAGAASQVEGERVKHMVKLVKHLALGQNDLWRVNLERGY